LCRFFRRLQFGDALGKLGDDSVLAAVLLDVDLLPALEFLLQKLYLGAQ
jgi:hypothetical protein